MTKHSKPSMCWVNFECVRVLGREEKTKNLASGLGGAIIKIWTIVFISYICSSYIDSNELEKPIDLNFPTFKDFYVDF